MGNNTRNIIEINGKRYDAVSGTLLGAASRAEPVSPRSPSRSVDGFTRPNHAHSHSQKTPSSIPSEPLQPILKKIAQPVSATSPSQVTAAIKKHSVHLTAKHASAHTPQPAKTLMRSAVSKPDIQSPAHIKAHTRTDILAKVPAHMVAPKLSHSVVNPERLKRAQRVIQSAAVSRYARPRALAALATQPAVPPTTHSAPVTHQAPSVQHVQHVTPAVQPSHATHVSHSGRAMDGMRTPLRSQHRATSHGHSTDMLEKALASAISHEQTFEPATKGRKAGRFAKLTTVTLTALLLVAFFGYQNLPNLNMRLASSRAGFHAKMPGYSPSGFSFGKLSYQPGAVNVSYVSDKNGTRRFDISQKASTWDSEALLSNFVAGASKSHETYQQAGRTVYIYGENTATWVDSGVWYIIDGNTSLNRDQLVDVATSI